jgi:hypothetical protein
MRFLAEEQRSPDSVAFPVGTNRLGDC